MAQMPRIDAMDLWHQSEPRLTVTVTMTGVREFKYRIWIASRLVALACRIGHMGFELETDQGEAGA